jgi:hypothetical protein
VKIGVTMEKGEPRIETWDNVERVVVDSTDADTLIIEVADGSRWTIPDDEYSTVVVLEGE